LVYCGYIGGDSYDYGCAIAVDIDGDAYVTGFTRSGEQTFPVVDGPGLTYKAMFDAFVAKVDATGTAFIYCHRASPRPYRDADSAPADRRSRCDRPSRRRSSGGRGSEARPEHAQPSPTGSGRSVCGANRVSLTTVPEPDGESEAHSRKQCRLEKEQSLVLWCKSRVDAGERSRNERCQDDFAEAQHANLGVQEQDENAVPDEGRERRSRGREGEKAKCELPVELPMIAEPEQTVVIEHVDVVPVPTCPSEKDESRKGENGHPDPHQLARSCVPAYDRFLQHLQSSDALGCWPI
ncbi:MAG: hypothetical protein JJ992_15135, partial [Planctomycetes bacterium]|nr:hypothetical protein [Planctomycetota bacterium]